MIVTERLVLRPWRADDAEAFAAITADPEVMAHLGDPLGREASDALLRRLQAHIDRHGFGFWAVEVRATGRLAGFTGLIWVPVEAHFTPAVEIGWRLGREHWGQGFASEAARASASFGFDALGLAELVAITVPGNLRSRRVMERLGMSRDPAEDFDHPGLAEDSPLRRHVLYRLKAPAMRSA